MSGPKRGPSRSGVRAGGRAELDLTRWLAQRLPELLPHDSAPSWVVAFSGGADSLALLTALQAVVRAQPAARRVALRAVHVDHGINPRSRAWAAHCRRRCRELGVPLTVRRARLLRTRGASLEALAREARYRLLGACLKPGELLMTAHHRDDQLETVLLQLLRGAGVAGLAAMPEVARFGRGWLLRPLLSLERPALRAWAEAHGLAWVEDDSNGDERFDRNYLRHRVLPALTARWSAAAQVVARSAAHLADARAVLDEVAAADLTVSRSGRRARRLPRCRRCRRRAGATWPVPGSWRAGCRCPTRGIWRAWSASCVRRAPMRSPACAGPAPRSGVTAAVSTRSGSRQCRVPRPRTALRRAHCPGPWRRRRELPLGAGLGSLRLQRDPAGNIDGARLPPRLEVRWRAGGERLRTEARGPRRTLKELLRLRGVLPWMRDRLPLLLAGDQLVAVAGLAVAADFQAAAGTRSRWRLEWHEAPEHLEVGAQPEGTSATPDRQ